MDYKSENLKRMETKMAMLNPVLYKTCECMHKLALEEFSNLIDDDEEVMFFSAGSLEKGDLITGLIFVTNKRFALCVKALSTTLDQFYYDQITSIDYKKTWYGQGIIEINSYSEKIHFYYNDPGSLISVIKYVREKMYETNQQKNVQQPIHFQPVDVVDQLEKLARLKNQGILSQEEFDVQKTKLLSRL
ncbi:MULTISPECIES: PH domain-containing protein [unclassified Paenibacillus]|uniref:PH domain-containing protein n=1 Tax=unclassified Paenibacillus TaxID=185978 RepID=UPI00020D7C6E|nr:MULTISPECIES: PH domain-containing protein [unclassified Paenibacillus]EGL15486.1 hypothetical protein HMPREF9413_3861 [Paenibacillus sp. HGF7]EPD81915.1 hypothetical protein HMPREF1207_03741 [Paenibacillus sp. HGH0039]